MATTTRLGTNVVCAILLVVLGLVALGGWLTGNGAWAGFGAGYIPMAPSTAAMFIVVSAALTLLDGESRSRDVLPPLCALPGLFGVIKLAEFFLDSRLSIDALFVRRPAAFGHVLTGRMSPVTAAGFVLLGSALTVLSLSERPRQKSVAGACAIAALCAGAVVVLGYLYGEPLLYGGRVIPVALTTALGLITAGCGAIAAAGSEAVPLRYFAGEKTRALLLRHFIPLTILSVLAEGVVGHWAEQRTSIHPALVAAALSLLCAAVAALVVSKFASTIGRALEQAHEDRLRLEKAREVFGLFTTPEVARFALEHMDHLARHGERATVTVLFADVRRFTPYASTVPPEEAVAALNEIFDHVVRAVAEEGGILNKFLGDGVMALFGAPVVLGDHAAAAARAAIRIQQAVERMAGACASEGRPALRVGIGINTGETVAGYIGARERIEYSVIGHAVNLAARLEKAAGAGQVLVGPSTAERLSDGPAFAVRALGQRQLPGLTQPVEVFELTAATARGGSRR